MLKFYDNKIDTDIDLPAEMQQVTLSFITYIISFSLNKIREKLLIKSHICLNFIHQ